MKLFYCPSYAGFVYSVPDRPMFNEKIVDTAALVDEIKLRTGLSSRRKEVAMRMVGYYKAMKKYMETTPGNLLSSSFSVDGLSVAKECLA